MEAFEAGFGHYIDYECLAETSVTVLEAARLWGGLQKSEKKKEKICY